MLQTKLALLFAGAWTIGLALPAQAQQQATALAALDRIIAPLEKVGGAGCAVAAERAGQRIATRAFGMAELEHDIPNSPETIFEAGSVSKQFTAAATLLLVEDGKLALDDDIRKYVPEMPDYGTPITIDQLLSHTSGLRDWGAIASITGWPRGTRAYNNDDAMRIAAAQRSLNYVPGSEYSYTNSGYNLLAVIVERVSGQSLAAFSQARLFAPLGMSNTSWRDDFQRVVKKHAVAYSPVKGGGYAEARPSENVYGNGGLLTTVGDLMIWNAALAANKLGARLTERMPVRATLTGGQQITYARGVVVSEYKGVATVSHSGATGGYRAWLERFPASDLSIAVLCNGSDLNPGNIGRQLADKVLGLSEPVAKAVRANNIAARQGMYVNTSTGATSWIDLTDDGLKVRGGEALKATGRNDFQSAAGRYEFSGASGFTFTDNNGQPYRFERTAPAPSNAALDSYAGNYVSEEASGARYAVTTGSGELTLRLIDRTDQKFAAPIVLKPTYQHAFEDGKGVIVRFEQGAMVLGMPRVRALKFVRL